MCMFLIQNLSLNLCDLQDAKTCVRVRTHGCECVFMCMWGCVCAHVQVYGGQLSTLYVVPRVPSILVILRQSLSLGPGVC